MKRPRILKKYVNKMKMSGFSMSAIFLYATFSGFKKNIHLKMEHFLAELLFLLITKSHFIELVSFYLFYQISFQHIVFPRNWLEPNELKRSMVESGKHWESELKSKKNSEEETFICDAVYILKSIVYNFSALFKND